MSARTIAEKFQCDACGEIHDTVYGAIECCPPKVFGVFVCPVCGDYSKTVEEALQCWQECEPQDETTSGPIGPTGPELEAQGQMRLATL